ncbi:MAG: copper amine oxidase N-terminal domain-containing protein [Bacillota bacterium]
MIKARKKWLCILVALTFLLSLLPVSPALAAEYFKITGAYVYVDDDDNQNLGTVTVVYGDDLPSISGDVYIEVTLPEDTDLDAAADYDVTGGSKLSNTSRKVLVQATDINSAEVEIDFTSVDIKSGFTGSIVAAVKVWNYDGGVKYETTANVTIAKIKTSAVTITADSPKTVTVGSGKTGAKITIDEDTPGALSAGDTILLTIQKSGVSWDDDVLSTSNIVYSGLTVSDWEITGTNDRTLSIEVGTPSSSIMGSIEITPKLIVEPGTSDGDVDVKVAGDVDSKTVTIAKVGEGTVDITVKKADKDTVYLGQTRTMDDVTVTLDPSTKFDDDDYITITLPKGLKWADGTASLNADCTNLTVKKLYNDDQSIWLAFDAEVTDDVVLDEFVVKADANAETGDLEITFGGAVTGTAVIGQVKAPFTVEAEKVNVNPLGSEQAAGKITITEVASGALQLTTIDRLFDLVLPMGVQFSGAPEVEVTEGDLEIGDVTVDGDTLTIEITEESNLASTIEITEIEYDIDNRASAGDIKVSIGKDYNEVSDKAIATVVNAAIVSPTKRDASFVIDSTTYTVNGEEQTMDVAPYIKNDRTYMPVRYAALACGVDEDNIIWDGVNRTVTLIKGDRVVQMTIGSKVMQINGASITMDVAPEIAAPGRTMLPFRFVAQALGATVTWDGTTQTVYMSIR